MIDAAGRIVIPSSVRRRLHLRPGTRFSLTAESDRLTLEPLQEDQAVKEEEGLLVATGALVGELADHRELRDDRTRKLGRW